MPAEGSVEVGFARDTAAHHARAVEPAADAVTPAVVALAGAVRDSQAAEVAAVEGQLAGLG